MTTIYFSHSVSDYNTDYEKRCLEKIKERFPGCTIINPKDIHLSNEEIKKIKGNYIDFIEVTTKRFFSKIDECDFVLSFPNQKGTLTSGTITEINYSKQINKPFEQMSLLKKVVGEEWQAERKCFYDNSKATSFIKYYFESKKGVRCLVGHTKNYTSPTYYVYGKNNTQKMMTTENIEHLYEFNCIHSFIYTFDKSVTEFFPTLNRVNTIENSIKGMNAVIEIDAPYENESEGAKRKDFFSHIKDFNNTIKQLDKILNERGEEYNMMFSGNGIYFLLEGWYEDDIDIYTKDFINIIDNLKETELGNELKAHIDNKAAPWNDYFKIPFTFHEKKPTISCPLPKGEIDSDWLYRVSNIDNIFKDYTTIINEIIHEAQWRKLW